MPVVTALLTGAVCDLCGASIAHASSSDAAVVHFERLRWTFFATDRGVLAACPNSLCALELASRAEAAGRPLGAQL